MNEIICGHIALSLQANEVGSSNKMELDGAKHSFDAIKVKEKLPIKTFVSDRHRGISKWMRTTQTDATHYYIWHQSKKILKASKERLQDIKRVGEIYQ